MRSIINQLQLITMHIKMFANKLSIIRESLRQILSTNALTEIEVFLASILYQSENFVNLTFHTFLNLILIEVLIECELKLFLTQIKNIFKLLERSRAYSNKILY